MQNKIIVVVKGVILNQNKVLIIKRDDRDQVGAGAWECAGGKIDFGETLEDALLREVREEVGLDVTVEKLLYAATFYTDPTREVIVLTYKCRAEHTQVLLSEEHSEYRWVDEDEFRRVLHPPIIADMEKYGALGEIYKR